MKHFLKKKEKKGKIKSQDQFILDIIDFLRLIL